MTNLITLESQIKTKTTPSDVLKTVQIDFNVLNHIIAFTVGSYMSFLCINYNIGHSHSNYVLTSWHSGLCTLGYQVLMVQSIMSIYTHNVWSKNYKNKTKRTLHWVMQAIGSMLALIGISLEFINRYQQSEAHFTSKHSIIGLIAAICTLFGMISGMSSLWSVELRNYTKPVYFKLVHNVNGIAAFVLGMVSIYFGFEYNKWFIELKYNDVIQLLMQTFVIISIILTLMFGALRSLETQSRAAFG